MGYDSFMVAIKEKAGQMYYPWVEKLLGLQKVASPEMQKFGKVEMIVRKKIGREIGETVEEPVMLKRRISRKRSKSLKNHGLKTKDSKNKGFELISKKVRNVDEEVLKVMEIRAKLGLDFVGKEAEMTNVIRRIELEDADQCGQGRGRDLHNKNYDGYEDLQIVRGNATTIGKISLGLGDEIDARTFGVEDRHTTLDDFIYDETNEAFVANQNEPSHQPPPLGQSFSPLPFPATSSEVHPVSTSQRKRTKTDNEGNTSSSKTNNKAVIMEKISLSIDFIAADFWGVHSLLEKREKNRPKSEMEKREKERQSCIWDAIKKTPYLDERARYKAVA
ncbi:hypothetical protein LWI28_015530 [Acer negundo]|uniref:At2g29880-like C-terminal domain-containing protein n=1 Tax=Acer negundo TaxID=4023 RepID=A0AAD5J635_ACENE|nr:hypothetical protein LWI28_015530 [Acer negundo]